MIYDRYIHPDIIEICFNAGKMAFMSGPRQCGKTTFAKLLLKERGEGAYYNWDETKFRRLWTKDPSLILSERKNQIKPIIILDELHKAKLWKRSLKGLQDTQDDSCDILVTGSARLNTYRKGSDSLLGRYYHFRLHPFSTAEILKNPFTPPENLINKLSSLGSQNKLHSLAADTILKNLYEFGPFPEPYITANERRLNLWRRNRLEKIIREDLRDLSRLPELSQIEMLASLIPERVAEPLSIRSLSEDLEVSYMTIKRWINYLNELYYVFLIKPYSKSLHRSIKKERKLYVWDWSEVENNGARYENLIAGHLLKYCDYLTDTGRGTFELSHLKNKEKNELDFLILKNSRPWLPIEAKLNDDSPGTNWEKFMPQLKCSDGFQLVFKPNIYKIHSYETYKIHVVSAASFLQFLV